MNTIQPDHLDQWSKTSVLLSLQTDIFLAVTLQLFCSPWPWWLPYMKNTKSLFALKWFLLHSVAISNCSHLMQNNSKLVMTSCKCYEYKLVSWHLIEMISFHSCHYLTSPLSPSFFFLHTYIYIDLQVSKYGAISKPKI